MRKIFVSFLLTQPEPSHVKLEVFNILGQKVVTLVDEKSEAGYYSVKWDGTDADGNEVATGIYLYRLKAGEFVNSKKMLLIK